MRAAMIDVDYKFRDGWHVFTSRQLHGLYVASRDAEAAYHDVGNAIAKLLGLNENINARVEPVDELSDFLKLVRGGHKPATTAAKSGHYVVHSDAELLCA